MSIIEAQSHIMANLDEDMTHDLHNHIRSKGVKLCLNAMAAEFTEDSVILASGAKIPADMILSASALPPRPAFWPAAASSWAAGRDPGGRKAAVPAPPMSMLWAMPFRCGTLSPDSRG